MSTSNSILIGPFSQILTFDGPPLKGPISDENLPILMNGQWILIQNGHISKIGSYNYLKKEPGITDVEIIHLTRNYVCLPGLIDCHTHICFDGSREKDYAMRNAGKNYQEIAKSGGGIWDTVTQTRKANQQSLEQGVIKRANRHLAEGITTLEVKSGYGLSTEEELKMLRAIQNANKNHPADLIGTCLAAHILPKDFDGSDSKYLDHLIDNLLPEIKKQNLTNRIDIFIEEGAFSKEASKIYLRKAQALGFSVTTHADQFNIGGSEVAVECGAISADHLEASTEVEINLLAKSNVIPVALPGASIGLGCSFAPARKLLDAGASLAIASDWNPGSAPMGDLLMQAAVLGTHEKLSNAEVLSGITYRAAASLGLHDRGKITTGYLADLTIFACDNFNEILYHQGKLKPTMVLKKGILINIK
ncbi:MAG: imidazolonepropionase [Cyclobacteriaceae bacterium]